MKNTVAIGDVRKSVKENELSQLVSDGIDKIEEEISVQLQGITKKITPRIAKVSKSYPDMSLRKERTAEAINNDEDPQHGHSDTEEIDLLALVKCY